MINCNYNECSTGSQNRGVLYDYPSDNKEKKNLEEDDIYQLKLLYTALTRARKSVDIVTPHS